MMKPVLRDSTEHSATVLDPVCEMEIRAEQAVAVATLEGGRRFYFCSLACHEAFLDLPHAYVGWLDA
jgi:YHS domain-containing protein